MCDGSVLRSRALAIGADVYGSNAAVWIVLIENAFGKRCTGTVAVVRFVVGMADRIRAVGAKPFASYAGGLNATKKFATYLLTMEAANLGLQSGTLQHLKVLLQQSGHLKEIQQRKSESQEELVELQRKLRRLSSKKAELQKELQLSRTGSIKSTVSKRSREHSTGGTDIHDDVLDLVYENVTKEHRKRKDVEIRLAHRLAGISVFQFSHVDSGPAFGVRFDVFGKDNNFEKAFYVLFRERSEASAEESSAQFEWWKDTFPTWCKDAKDQWQKNATNVRRLYETLVEIHRSITCVTNRQSVIDALRDQEGVDVVYASLSCHLVHLKTPEVSVKLVFDNMQSARPSKCSVRRSDESVWPEAEKWIADGEMDGAPSSLKDILYSICDL